MPWVPFACTFIAAFVVVLATTPLARVIAVRLGAVDYPSKRRINTRPVPRMGGIAVMLGLMAAAAVLYAGSRFWGWPAVLVTTSRLNVNYVLLAVSMVCVFIVGAVDDVRALKPLPKLVGQVVAASIAAASGLVIGDIVNPFAGGEVSLGVLSYPITVVYLVAFSNIINLIDGLDGLASGVTCISSLTMFVLSYNAGRTDAAVLAVVLCGATLAFLRYNFNPATVFLGDSGSLLLGFGLGCVSLLSVTRVAGVTTLLLPLVLAGIPIIDTFSAIVRRSRAHVPVGQADKGHIHHRLIQEGFDQRQAVVLIYLWTIALCVGAVLMSVVPVWPRIAVFLFLAAFSLLFALRLGLFRPVLLHHYDSKGRDSLITPDDPSFAEEAKRQHVDHTLPRFDKGKRD